jgi:hypothetical protein
MNLKELRTEAWDIARETGTTDDNRLWTTKEMNRYINRTYRNIAKETRCIRDSETTSLCLISCPVVDYTTYTPGTLDYIWANTLVDPLDPTSGKYWLFHKNVCAYKYTLSPLILDIEEVKWTDRQWKLVKTSVKKWQINPWWEQVVGMPTEYALDLSNNILALNFRSEVADTLRLQVKRLPLVDLVADTDEPEYRTNYHDLMINGILWQMYSKQDTQTFDGEKAADYQLRYKQDVDEIKQQESWLDSRLRPNYSMDGFR